jgi:hypothetical protein
VGAYPQPDLHGGLLPYGLYVPRGFLKLIRPAVERWMSVKLAVEMTLKAQQEGRIICWKCGHLWPVIIFGKVELLRLLKRARTGDVDLEAEIRGHYRDHIAECPQCGCRSHLAESRASW